MKKNNTIEYILVTGGAGFIGSHLCEKLLAHGKSVICLDNFNDFYDPKIKQKNISECRGKSNFKLIKGDITSQAIVKKVFKDNQINMVYHLAARAGVRPSLLNPGLYQKTNVEGTLNLLQAAAEHKVGKFIFASSSSVYGNNKKIPFAETDSVDNPISPYAATKKAGELLAYTYHHLYKMPVACMRFFTVYGPRQRPEMAIHKFIHNIIEGKPIDMYGNGQTKRDYTYIDDIINGLLKIQEMNYGYEIYNLGNSDTIALKDLIKTIGEKLKIEPKINKLPVQPGDVEITYADIAKSKKEFGYDPKTKISQGIEKTIAWYKNK